MFNREIRKRFEVNSHEVIDFVRLLGRFGLRFQISDEYYVFDDIDPNKKERFRRFTVFGTKKQLNEFYEARDILYRYLLH